MTVKDIVKIAAVFLNRRDVKEYLDGNAENLSEQTESAVSTLTDLTNIVVNELACSYIPAVKCEDVTVKNMRVYYKDLSESPLKILKVRDLRGREVSYSYSPEFITVNQSALNVEYEYSPKAKTLEQEICFAEKDVPARVVAYGLAAEYSIVLGEFNEAVTWHKRYTDGIAAICAPTNAQIKNRSFI